MKKLLLLLSLGFFSNFLLAQVDYVWSVGATYKPFFFTLLNEADDTDERFKKVDEGQVSGHYYGINGNYHFYNNVYLGGGLGYSKQVFKSKYANIFLEEQAIGYGQWTNLSLNYIHLPFKIGYQLSANHLDFMGARFYLGGILSYNSSYFYEFTNYSTKTGTNEINFDKVSGYTTRTRNTHKGIGYDNEGEIDIIIENEITYPINKWNIGLQSGTDIYFIISQTVNVNIGIWYNYDFMRTESKDQASMTGHITRPANAYSNNQRVGLSVGLEWLIF
jgi:hypothetical protein